MIPVPELREASWLRGLHECINAPAHHAVQCCVDVHIDSVTAHACSACAVGEGMSVQSSMQFSNADMQHMRMHARGDDAGSQRQAGIGRRSRICLR